MANALTIQSLSDEHAIELARESSTALARLLQSHPDEDRTQGHMDGEDLMLPRQAIDLLRTMLAEMAQGNGITVLPVRAQLTTQEAANLLNLSRPFLVKLLENNVLPFTKVGSHRRIALADLLEYKRKRDEAADAAMQELADQAQELGLGY